VSSGDQQVNVAAGRPDQPPLWLSRAELAEMGYVQMTNGRASGCGCHRCSG
jgi:hypothetical protein